MDACTREKALLDKFFTIVYHPATILYTAIFSMQYRHIGVTDMDLAGISAPSVAVENITR
jgi:hypothetical protein